jgi:predicted nucleotidyltransferase
MQIDRNVYQPLVAQLLQEIRAFYGNRLVTLALFGSYARNDMRNDSDLDLLIIADNLPKGRMPRVEEFLRIEKKLEPLRSELSGQNLHPYFSPILKTPEDAAQGSPLFLDMTEEIDILFDRDDFFRRNLDGFKERLRKLGSKRVWVGKMWYWILKPDLKPGETFSL